MSNISLVLKFYVFFSIFVLVLAIWLFIYTRKYKKSKVRLLGLFLNLTKRECILLSTNVLGFLLNIWCAINISSYNNLFLVMILVNAVVTIVGALDLHIVAAEIVYTGITVVVLKLLSLINIYLNNVSYNVLTHSLSIIFLLTIIVYSCFICIRKLELLLKKNKIVGGNV